MQKCSHQTAWWSWLALPLFWRKEHFSTPWTLRWHSPYQWASRVLFRASTTQESAQSSKSPSWANSSWKSSPQSRCWSNSAANLNTCWRQLMKCANTSWPWIRATWSRVPKFGKNSSKTRLSSGFTAQAIRTPILSQGVLSLHNLHSQLRHRRRPQLCNRQIW